jgi:cytochrome c peroxidase
MRLYSMLEIRSRLTALLSALVTGAALALAGCGGGGTEVNNTGEVSGDWTWFLPAGFPVPVTPADNPMSAAKVSLGRFLFYDTRLSGNGTQSCASCHLQSLAFTDGRATALGSTGQSHPRNAQPLVNVVYNATLTWANYSLVDLERQALAPLFGDNPVEMGVNDANQAEVLARIATDSGYQPRFAAAFPGSGTAVSWDNIIKAIAAFQRSIVSADSKYDRVQRGVAIFTASEARGAQLFNGEKAECFHCHGSFNFNEQVRFLGLRVVDTTSFHNTGLYNIDGVGGFPFPNRGIYELSGRAADMGKFRAQSLRNVAVTAPYMHDGSIATLEEVLDFYAAGGRVISGGTNAGDGRNNPYKSDLVSAINLSTQDKADLVAFLKTLTDETLLTDARFSNPWVSP